MEAVNLVREMQLTPRKLGTVAVWLAVFAGLCTFGSAKSSAQVNQRAAFPLRQSPLHFEKSKNSSDGTIEFSARGESYSLFISRDETDIVLHGEAEPSGEVSRGKLIVVHAYASLLRMRFVESDRPTSIGPLALAGRPHGDPAAVAYRGVYPGTDVVLRGDQQRIGFQLNLSPGADFSHIVLELAGATGLTLDAKGNAIVRVGRASLVLQRPIVKISARGEPQWLTGAYRVEAPNRLRFIVVAPVPDMRVLQD
jgi:hypothetical protein